jgi:2'-5' RNA ligase
MNARSRFFIALLPPIALREEINAFKHYFSEVYQSHAALRSPPHVTLQPPFEWEKREIEHLSESLTHFSRGFEPLRMALDGFSAFKPRVIYIQVQPDPQLSALQHSLNSHLAQNFQLIHAPSQSRPFTPHLTVAFRDLSKENFYRAWQEFEHKKIFYKFSVPSLTLLRHNGKQWTIEREFPFTSNKHHD